MQSLYAHDFDSWRNAARTLLANGVHPFQVLWNHTETQHSLFPEKPLSEPASVTHVPKDFLSLANAVSCHRAEDRWTLLYQALWRLTHGEKHLLKLTTDPVTHALQMMEKAVRRDVHKTKAFVRFRKTEDGMGEHYIAWHRPDHLILRLAAPFFQRRFSVMRWTILTPDESAHWDGDALHYGPGVRAEDAPKEDTLEDLWKEYYRATFNPARIKIKAMKKEMPVRHWATLPEAELIPELLASAPKRVDQMIAHQEGLMRSAADYLPEDHSIPSLREASAGCRGCELYVNATQTVFGTGPEHAEIMLVGEQPGDEEDLSGKPFVGPAGKVLDRALQEARLPRGQLYVTNSVKHFKFSLNGEQRHHRTPSLREVTGCRPWLEAEIEAIKPKAIVCLGATASRSLISPGFTLKQGRGQWLERNGIALLPTYHPSAVLRARDEAGQQIYQDLVEDLTQAAFLLEAA